MMKTTAFSGVCGLLSRRIVSTLACLACATAPWLDAQINWDGDCSEFWEDGCPDPDDPNIPPATLTNWDNEGYPQSDDDVVIAMQGAGATSVGTVTINKLTAPAGLRIRGDFSADDSMTITGAWLDLNAGRIVSTPVLTLQGDSIWSGGDLDCGIVAIEGTLTVQGNSSWVINETVISNRDTVQFEGSRQLRDDSVIFNTALWDISAGNANLSRDVTDSASRFTNEGSAILRRSGEGTSSIGVPLINEGGRIEVTGGALNLTAGAEIQSGSVEMSNNAFLQFVTPSIATVVINPGLAFTGTGNVGFLSTGIVEVRAAVTSSLSTNSTLGAFFDNGSRVVLDAEWNNTGRATWNAPEISGASLFFNAESGVLTVNGGELATTLVTRGLAEQHGNLTLQDGDINVSGSGVYRMTGGVSIFDPPGSMGVFRVFDGGTLEHDSDNGFNSTIDTRVEIGGSGAGRVRVLNERLTFSDGGRFGSMTTFDISPSAALALSASEFEIQQSFDDEVQFSGLGALYLPTGATLRVIGERSTHAISYLGREDLEASGFILDGGTLTGTGIAGFSNFGVFIWNGGTIDFPSDTGEPASQFRSVATVIMRGSGVNEGRIDNNGTWRHESGILSLSEDAEFVNSAFYELMDNASIAGSGLMLNSLRIRSNGNTRISSRFSNRRIFGDIAVKNGHVLVESGTLALEGTVVQLDGFDLRGGKWETAAGATLEFPSEIRVLSGAAEVINNGIMPDLNLQAIERSASFTIQGTSLEAGDVSNRGDLSNASQFRADRFVNEEGAEIESVLPYLRETTSTISAAESTVVAPRSSHTSYEAGFIVANGFENEGVAYPGGKDQPGYLPVDGDFTQNETGVLVVDLTGTENAAEQPAQYDQLVCLGSVSINGYLAVRLADTLASNISSDDTFVIVSAASVTGSFLNASSGNRIYTTNGSGSFLISYSGTDISLSQFEAGENPLPPDLPTLEQALDPDSGLLEITIRGTPGAEYTLEATEDLESWEHLETVFPSGNGWGRLFLPLPVAEDPPILLRALSPIN